MRVLEVGRDLAKFPCPEIQPLLAKFPFQHVGYVFSNHRQELEAVVRPDSADEQVLLLRVRADPEVQIARQCIPIPGY